MESSNSNSNSNVNGNENDNSNGFAISGTVLTVLTVIVSIFALFKTWNLWKYCKKRRYKVSANKHTTDDAELGLSSPAEYEQRNFQIRYSTTIDIHGLLSELSESLNDSINGAPVKAGRVPRLTTINDIYVGSARSLVRESTTRSTLQANELVD